jgi:Flp pilus assembly protein TadB
MAAAVVVAFATPALAAEFYVVQDSSTKRCQIVEQKPTGSTTVVVGDGKVFSSRTEAQTALSSIEVCKSTTGMGSESSTTTTIERK